MNTSPEPPPAARSWVPSTGVTLVCATVAVVGSFAFLGTTTAVFSGALLACVVLVVNAIVAEWTSFDVTARLFGAPAAPAGPPATPAEPAIRRIEPVTDPDEDTLPYAA